METVICDLLQEDLVAAVINDVEKQCKENKLLRRYVKKLEDELQTIKVNVAYIHHNLECYWIQ